MSVESSIRRALERLGAELEPVDDAEDVFHARVAAALAESVGAGAAVLLGSDSDGLRPLAQSAPIDPLRLARLRDARTMEELEARALASPTDAEMLMAPLRTADEVIGAVFVLDPTAGSFCSSDREVLELAAAAAAVVWRQRQSVQRLLRERKVEADRVRSEADRALELEDMKRRILNLAAHELRGPVTVIRGYLEMLADGSLDEPALRRVLPILNGKAAQMDALVTQMLDVARLDEGKLELKRDVVDLGSICRTTVDVAGLVAPAGITLFLERPPGPIRVFGDRDRLAAIIANLVDNAIKYSPDGGAVQCRTGVRDGRAYVEVRDRGLGIAGEDLPALFSRFGRIVTPENSHIPGTGLGLNLSRDLARMHGGDITVSSNVGQGSVFTLWLPLAETTQEGAS